MPEAPAWMARRLSRATLLLRSDEPAPAPTTIRSTEVGLGPYLGQSTDALSRARSWLQCSAAALRCFFGGDRLLPSRALVTTSSGRGHFWLKSRLRSDWGPSKRRAPKAAAELKTKIQQPPPDSKAIRISSTTLGTNVVAAQRPIPPGGMDRISVPTKGVLDQTSHSQLKLPALPSGF